MNSMHILRAINELLNSCVKDCLSYCKIRQAVKSVRSKSGEKIKI